MQNIASERLTEFLEFWIYMNIIRMKIDERTFHHDGAGICELLQNHTIVKYQQMGIQTQHRILLHSYCYSLMTNEPETNLYFSLFSDNFIVYNVQCIYSRN